MDTNTQNIIIYNTDDGKASVSLLAKDGQVWLNQQMLAELFDTSVPNINMHISNILDENELDANSVIKDYLTTAADGKNYHVTFYSLEMILAIAFRVRSKRGTQFRKWANRTLKEFLQKGFIIDDERLKNPNVTIKFWRENVDKILLLNDKVILTGNGSVSNLQMEEQVDKIYEQFNAKRKHFDAFEADKQDEDELKILELETKFLTPNS
ncbi:MAG: virulence RhuM family protein [Bacteroidales bacterium]|jgi:hypothetical protein|nr:virulence RhuM family protein [Bacteroidales bacterium]